MANSIELTIEATYQEKTTTIIIVVPDECSDHASIITEACDRWNDDHRDTGEDGPDTDTTEELIVLEVKDWGETPEKLRDLTDNFFDFCEEFSKSSYDVDVFEAAYNLDIPFSDIDEAYQGTYSTDQDFAQEMAEQLGSLDKNASWPMNCIDWEYAAKELMYDYSSDNGHYFRNL